jgi:hypothetical protein
MKPSGGISSGGLWAARSLGRGWHPLCGASFCTVLCPYLPLVRRHHIQPRSEGGVSVCTRTTVALVRSEPCANPRGSLWPCWFVGEAAGIRPPAPALPSRPLACETSCCGWSWRAEAAALQRGTAKSKSAPFSPPSSRGQGFYPATLRTGADLRTQAGTAPFLFARVLSAGGMFPRPETAVFGCSETAASAWSWRTERPASVPAGPSGPAGLWVNSSHVQPVDRAPLKKRHRAGERLAREEAVVFPITDTILTRWGWIHASTPAWIQGFRGFLKHKNMTSSHQRHPLAATRDSL